MATLIHPDLDFKRRIIGLDAHDLTACYQCGTCSSVCPLSTADDPFPRKEMVWVQWGQKARVLGSASIWLCHQCGACNSYCPRDARPANVMAALRDASIGHYAVPALMGRALAAPRSLPLLLGMPAVIFLVLLGWLGHLTSLPEGRVVFSKLLPIVYVEVVFGLAVGLAALGAFAGGVRYWRAMRAQAGGHGPGPRRPLFATAVAILRHVKFRECNDHPAGSRPTHARHLHPMHLLVFYGFLGLVVTTVSVGIGIYAFGYLTPWPFWHPVKLLGNASGAALLVALAVFLRRRLADGPRAGKRTYADGLFLAILSLTTLTGFLAQGLRLADLRTLAYPTYVIHLVFVFSLLVYLPYSKLAHLVYRPIAMLWAASRASEATSTPHEIR